MKPLTEQIIFAMTDPSLFQFHKGRVVYCSIIDMFGHVESFCQNECEGGKKETVLIVSWQNGETFKIHPANVKTIKPF